MTQVAIDVLAITAALIVFVSFVVALCVPFVAVYLALGS